MKNLHVAALATLFGLSATAGIFASTAAIASADQGEHGNGHHRNNSGNWQNGQCNTNGNMRGGDDENENDNDNDNDNEDNNQGSQGNQDNRSDRHGEKRGWQNPNNPHYCGNGNCGYNNGQYPSQYNGPYGQNNGQNGQYNGQCNTNNGQGNSVIRGTITSVSGNQVTLLEGFGQAVTINDQPALDNQSTGRVVIGRYVTAYGYYQNGIFYATSMQ